MYKFIHMSERDRHTGKETERAREPVQDSKTDKKSIYQNPSSSGSKGDLNILCLLICIFYYEHASLKYKSNKTIFLIPFLFSEFH